MKGLKALRNKSIKYTWIASYFTLFLLPVIISVIMFLIIDGTIKKEVNKSNYFILKQMQQYMDNLASDIEKLTIDLALNDRVAQARGMEGELSAQQNYRLYELHKDLRSRVNNNAIEDVYIYFKKLDIVVSGKNIMDSKLFFDMMAQSNSLDVNEWININSRLHNGAYINMNNKNGGLSETSKKLAYIQSTPLSRSMDNSANIVVVVDKTKLLAMMEDIEILGKGAAAIIDSSGEIILKSGESDIFKNLKYQELDSSDIKYESIHGKNFAVSHIDSGIKKWKYVYIMPTSVYWGKLEEFRKLIYAGMLLCLISGGFVSYYLFKKNYEPIRQLLKSLSEYPEKENEDNRNEYNIIKDVITRSNNEKKEIDQWISFQKEVLRCRYIENLLKGRASDSTSNSQSMLDIVFKWDNFAVAYFNIHDMGRIAGSDSSDPVDSLKLVQFVIQNIIDELLGDKGNVFTLDIDNSIICLLNLNNNSDELRGYCKEVGYKIQDLLQKYYSLHLTIGMSNIHVGVRCISQAYEETQEVIEFSEAVGGEGVLFYNEISAHSDRDYYYPLEQEQLLIQAIKTGDFSKVSTILDDIFVRNFQEKPLSNSMVRCLKFSLIGTLINTVNNIIDNYGEEYHKDLAAIEELVQFKSMNKLKESLMAILKDICDRINMDKKMGSQVGDKVIEFINRNYKDENLNISIIAEAFKLHPSYISKLFKLQTGEGILDFISRVRIEEAKKLLKDQRGTLENIATSVGYSNVRTFTRVFTKITGISPGKYKED